MTTNLNLVLKKKWYDMIATGEKTEEYRDVKPYWEKRLLDYKSIVRDYELLVFRRFLVGKGVNPLDYPRGFETVTFRLGYQKNAPRMTFELKSITIGKGRSEWGAAPNKQYFIIKLGDRIDGNLRLTDSDIAELGCCECEGAYICCNNGESVLRNAITAWNKGKRNDPCGCYECFKKIKKRNEQ